jgi:PAS domain S-box-containing protein/putative nucleotidyltransferase with HDIG domain
MCNGIKSWLKQVGRQIWNTIRQVLTSNSYALIRLGIGFSIFFLVIDLIVDVYVFHEDTVLEQIFTPAPYEIWLRINVFILILGFSGYVQYFAQRLQIKQDELELELAEHKQAEEALLESDNRFRLLVDKSPYGISIHQDGKIAFVNEAAVAQIGAKSADDLIGRKIQDFVHPDTWNDTLNRIQLMLRGEPGLYPVEDRYVRTDGIVIPVLVTAAPFTFKGRPAIQVIAQDMTERKRAEEALNRAEANYQSIFENATVGIFQSTPEGRFQNVNPAIARIYGYDSPEEMLSNVTDITKQIYVDQVSRDVFQHQLATRGEVTEFEDENFRKDGSRIWTSTNARAVKDSQDKVSYYEGFITDITERRRAQEKIQYQLQRLAALRMIDDTIIGSFDSKLSLNAILNQAVSLLKMDAVCVFLLNPQTLELNYEVGRGFRTNTINTTRFLLGEGYAGKAALNKTTTHIPDLRKEIDGSIASHRFPAEDFVTYYAVPLIAKGKVVGLLEVFQRSLIDLDQDWRSFLESLAKQAAIAVDNAQLFISIQQANYNLSLAYDNTIEGWSRALDLRDKETEGHSQRVTEITLSIARAIGMKDNEIVHVRRGALLHDIGKMGVPDVILFKSDQLTENEWKLMRQHPRIAYDMLFPIAYLRPALDIPYCHHEKWDGTGYPRGLKGEEIPIAARIFAVVDVSDALISDRPYRAKWPPEKVFEHIRSLSGTHFDPKVVEWFLQVAANKSV